MVAFIIGFVISLLVLGTFGAFMSVAGPVLIPLFTGVCIFRAINWFLNKS